jgi:cytochrome oxidase assembly protein ShyY1
MLTLVVFSFAIACFTLLSPWQFGRNDEREAQNSALAASFTGQARPLAELLPGGAAPDDLTQWHLVTVTGTYVPQAEVVARLRTVQGEPAFEVLAPFRTAEGDVLLVDRGYLRPDTRSTVPPYAAPPGGVVQLTVRIREDEVDGRNRDAFADASTGGKLQSYVVNSQVVGRATGLAIRPGYFQLESNQPGTLSALPLPQTDSGPFLSYALQWIAFGAMAFLGWLYFTVREMKPGGALAVDQPADRRKSVAQMVAEDEASERDAASEEAGRVST